MADPTEMAERGGPWVREVCARLEVPVDAVDIPRILDLTREVAHRKARPLGPVSAFMLGLAVGRHSDADADVLYEQILSTLPPPTDD